MIPGLMSVCVHHNASLGAGDLTELEDLLWTFPSALQEAEMVEDLYVGAEDLHWWLSSHASPAKHPLPWDLADLLVWTCLRSKNAYSVWTARKLSKTSCRECRCSGTPLMVIGPMMQLSHRHETRMMLCLL